MVENNNSVLYTALADRVNMISAKSILLSIASNHHQHAGILKTITEGSETSRPKIQNTEKEFAAVFGTAYDIYKEIIKKEEITKEELPAITQRLSVLENALTEKYVDIQSKTLKKETSQPDGPALKSLASIFARMIGDSVHHRELLSTVKMMVEVKQQEKILDAVVLSCLTPDITASVCQTHS